MDKKKLPGTLLSVLVCFSVLMTGCVTPEISSEEAGQLAQDYTQLGRAFYQEGDYKNAVDYLRRAYELKPGTLGLAFNYALSLLRIGNYERADALLNSLLAEDPTQAYLYPVLAYSAALQEDYNAAEDYYQTLVTLREPNSSEIFNWVLVRMELERFDEAQGLLDQVPEEWLESQSGLLAVAGRLALVKGEYEEALNFLKQYQDSGGNEPSFLSDLAELYHHDELYLEEAGIRATLHRRSYEVDEQVVILADLYLNQIADIEQGFTWMKRAVEQGQGERIEDFISLLSPAQQDQIRTLLDAQEEE
jgi:Flp pilus assembly protein TadD